MGAFGSYDTDPENDDFVPGTTIRSSEVDANFDKLKNHLNSPFVDDACVAPDADIDGSKLADASIDASKFDPAINLTFFAEEEFFFSVPGETIVLAAGPLSTAQPVRLFSGAGQSGTEYDGPDTGGVIGAGGSTDFTVDHANGTVTHVGGGAVPVLTPVYLSFDGIAIPPLSVGTGELQDNAVTQVKMADNSVGSDEIIDGSVGSDEIGTNAVGSDELADNAVDTAAIQDDAVTLDKLNDTGPAADNVIDYIDGTGQLIDTAVFTANGNFTKASYPDAKYVRVRAVGGGGGGGAADSTAANEDALGAFGGGGAYAERGPIDITTLPASVPVNVGPGGAGGTAGGAGTVGGESEFGIGGAYHTRAAGGAGGPGMPGGTGLISFRGGAGGLLSACLGDVISAGESGENSTRLPPAATGAAYAFCIPQGTSGGGPFGGSVRAPLADAAGLDGQGPGAGGSGGRAAGLGASDGGHTGGDGADGIVIVEVYS